MTHTNILNRKLEEVHGVGKEFGTVAALWSKFQGMVEEKQVSIVDLVVWQSVDGARMKDRWMVYLVLGGPTLRGKSSARRVGYFSSTIHSRGRHDTQHVYPCIMYTLDLLILLIVTPVHTHTQICSFTFMRVR